MNEFRKLRKELGWTQSEAGEELGCTRETISKYENSIPPKSAMVSIRALAQILKSGDSAMTGKVQYRSRKNSPTSVLAPLVSDVLGMQVKLSIPEDDSKPIRRTEPSAKIRIPVEQLCMRDMTTTTSGGIVVAGRLGSPAPPMFELYWLPMMGVRFHNLSDPAFSNNSHRPVTTGVPDPQWVDEDENLSPSDAQINGVGLTTRTVGSHTNASRMLARHMVGFARYLEDLVGMSLRKAVAHGLISGDGVKEPEGIELNAGIQTFAAATPGSFDVVDFSQAIKLLDTAEANQAFYGIVAHPDQKEKLMRLDYDGGKFWRYDKQSPTGEMAGNLPAAVSSAVTASKVILGDFSTVEVNHQGEIDINVHIAQGSTSGPKGRFDFYSFWDLDITLTHPEAFVVVTGA